MIHEGQYASLSRNRLGPRDRAVRDARFAQSRQVRSARYVPDRKTNATKRVLILSAALYLTVAAASLGYAVHLWNAATPALMVPFGVSLWGLSTCLEETGRA